MLSKRRRQQLIADLVRRHRVGTQLELARHLARAGCEVTQATVSRDIRELGLRKTRDDLGKSYYAMAEGEEHRDPERACRHMLEEFAIAIAQAENMVVVRCEIGTAPGVGRVLDELQSELVVGTVAGDDTVLIVTANYPDAASLTRYLGELGG